MDVDKLLAIVSDKKTVAKLEALRKKREEAEEQIQTWREETERIDDEIESILNPDKTELGILRPRESGATPKEITTPSRGVALKIYQLIKQKQKPLTKAEILKALGCSPASASNAFGKYTCFAKVGGGKNTKYSLRELHPTK